MSDASVTERRIRPIQDAVESSNWKQALQLCDKWSKKGEKSDRFLALKAFVLVNLPEKAHHDRGKTEILDLCKRNPPITEPEAIYQMQDALKCLSLKEEEGPKIWERAVIAKQNDKDLYTRWLNQAIADSDWLSAQKATMGLRKSFPKERQYEFWNIAMCHLIHMQHDLPEKNRVLFGTLAYRMMSKAAETTPADQEEILSPGKAISTPEEVSLLVQVLNSTGHAQESVKLLQGNSLHAQSRIGKQDPQLILSLLLGSLKESQQWQEAISACHGLLSKAEYQSDDRIWNLWLKALSELASDDLREQARELLDSVCSIRPIIRAAYMARMKFLQAETGDSALDDLLRTCNEYAAAFSQKAFCFDDMKAALGRLDKERSDDFRKTQSKASGSLAELFHHKLSYTSFSGDVSGQNLKAFIRQTLQLFQSSISSSPSCPEAAILAILAILRLSSAKPAVENILFAEILLEISRSKFEDYYLFTILLVQLQANLGLLSLAMETFNKLSVKNLQWETVSHLVLTRISTLHPSPHGNGGDAFDPLKAIDTGLTILENADNSLVRGIREGLRFHSYSNIYDSVEMRSNIEHSMNRQALAIEERALRRVLGLSEDTVLPPSPSSLVDKRDFGYLPAYRPDDTTLLANFRCGPLPKEKWIAAMTVFDNVATYLKAELMSQPILSSKVTDNLKDSLTNLDYVFENSEKGEFTGQELSNLDCYRVLTQAVLWVMQRSAAQDQMDQALSKISLWLSTTLEDRKKQPSGSMVADIRVPTWEDLHNSFSQLETLQVIAMLVGVLSRKPKPSSKSKSANVGMETLSKLQSLILQLEQRIHDDARDLKAQINAPGVLGKLVDLGLGREGEFTDLEGVLEKLCDEVTMETICGRIKASWEDGLDGVLAVKVKIYK
ncbi:hypothetical protein LTR67_010013 [Exophiala xenobiotica]